MINLAGLGGRYVALVDDEDLPLLAAHHWIAMNNGAAQKIYAMANISHRIGRGRIYMHRLIMDAKRGELIDHANRDTLDNRRVNLRRANKTLNNANAHTGHGVSLFKGVARSRSLRNPWRATIQVNGRSLHLGQFPTEQNAALAYDAAARLHFGEFALTNDRRNSANASVSE